MRNYECGIMNDEYIYVTLGFVPIPNSAFRILN